MLQRRCGRDGAGDELGFDGLQSSQTADGGGLKVWGEGIFDGATSLKPTWSQALLRSWIGWIADNRGLSARIDAEWYP
jgi:hypothetical protein